MNQDMFNLKWYTYTDHLREMLHDMMSSNELTDVTLVTEDKKHFRAHKVVLSASSPVFKSIISENLNSSPFIYLRGIQSQEIESILQFIYLGQATFYQERMKEFINVAKGLEIKEISKDLENEHKDVDLKKEFVETDEITSKDILNKQSEVKLKPNNKAQQRGYKNHTCEQCGYESKWLKQVEQHIKTVHEGYTYPCQHCNYKATDPSNLRRHIKKYCQATMPQK